MGLAYRLWFRAKNKFYYHVIHKFTVRRDVRGNRRTIGGGRRGGRAARKIREVETYVHKPTRKEYLDYLAQGFRRAMPSPYPWWL